MTWMLSFDLFTLFLFLQRYIALHPLLRHALHQVRCTFLIHHFPPPFIHYLHRPFQPSWRCRVAYVECTFCLKHIVKPKKGISAKACRTSRYVSNPNYRVDWRISSRIKWNYQTWQGCKCWPVKCFSIYFSIGPFNADYQWSDVNCSRF